MPPEHCHADLLAFWGELGAEAEVVDVDVAAGFLRGEIEDAEAVAHEVRHGKAFSLLLQYTYKNQ